MTEPNPGTWMQGPAEPTSQIPASEPPPGDTLMQPTIPMAPAAAPAPSAPATHADTFPDAPAPAELPRRYEDYELLQEIARGGMGVVYKARHVSLDRMVALKMVLAGPKASPTELERFAREARAAAALDHPNIVPVYDCGWHEGRPFFTMALIDGPSLQRWVEENGPPAPAEAAQLLRAVADAVAYAHEQGIVHRDIKPSNVLLDRQGRPRVADFGLARRLQEGEGLTSPGQVLGTPNYMAPEQAMGEAGAVAPAVDVWALGGVLYFLLTGKPPFSGPTAVSVLRRVVDEAPTPPHHLNAAAPPALQAICLKCLEKDPARRYLTAAALAAALAEWEAGPGAAPAKAPAKAGRRWLRLAAGATAAVAAGVLLAVLLRGGTHGSNATTPPPSPPQAPAEAAAVLPELPKDLRHDFGLKVELVGGQQGANGLRVIREGEKVRFRIETDRDAYVGIWTIAPDGTVVQLFPNDKDDDNLVRAGTRLVPPPDAGYSIDADVSPAGKAELLRVVATTRRFQRLEGNKVGDFVVLRPAERQRFEQHLRGLVVRERPDSKQPAADAVAEEALVYRVLPK